ncbi:MAG: DUF3795 domain-containing protein [Candidatus Heimdallarchaeota archaeon]
MEYDKTHAAVCGLYCPACTVFIASQEDSTRLKFLADLSGITPEEMKCNGCRSDKRIPYCDTCKLYPCAQEKGIDFCGECDDYPCDDLKEFQSLAPHRFELWEAQEEIVEKGYKIWMENMKEHYACPNCGIINSAYDFQCRSCGSTPSNKYSKRHGDKVKEFLAKQQQV